MSTTPATADAVFAAAFDTPRETRSAPYRHGVRECLRMREARSRGASCDEAGVAIRAAVLSYPEGSAERDAFCAGVDEGHALSQHVFPLKPQARA